MKDMKLRSLLLVIGLIVAGSGMAQAVDLEVGASISKTWNYDVATAYAGGEAGKLYFRTAGTTYHTEEHGLVSYTVGTDGLFDDLTVDKDPSAEQDEDTWGLLRLTDLFRGDVTLSDSRFGDGSDATPLGNDISAGTRYWGEGDGDQFLLGMFWGGQDQVVQCIVPDEEYRIWSAGAEFDIFEVDTASLPYNPATDPCHSPAARIDSDDFDGWFDRNVDRLVWGGELNYFRFQGNASNPNNFDGESEVLASYTRGDWAGLMQAWWTAPDGSPADLWQSWNIGDPFDFSNGWTASEDSGRGYVIPEPTMMCLLAVGTLGLLRKRRS